MTFNPLQLDLTNGKIGSLTPPLLKEVNMLYILTDNANIGNTFVWLFISICDRIMIAILYHI